MKGIHVNWTKPFFHRERLRGHGFRSTRELPGECYDQPTYQILYTILSAGMWKHHNGTIKLYTDSIGFNFYQQFGINDLYDEVDIKFLDGYSKTDIDPAYFWTSGKIKVLANQSEPFIFMDQDMIIRQPIPDYILEGDLTVTHWEIPRGYYYFEKEDWEKDIKHIEFPDNYNCNDLCPNTSFLAVNNMKLKSEYSNWHKKLVATNGDYVPEWFWLLTDQGILGHVIREGDYKANTLTDRVFLANSNYSDSKDRYKGKSEQWYLPLGATDKKDTDLVWEHVWFNKIHFNMFPEFLAKETKRYFRECIELGLGKYLQHSRFKKYWDEYNNTDN